MNKKTSAKMQRWGLDQVEGVRIQDVVVHEACKWCPNNFSKHEMHEDVTLGAPCLK